MIPFPNKKYKIIYADPAWSYNDRAAALNLDRKFIGVELDEKYFKAAQKRLKEKG